MKKTKRRMIMSKFAFKDGTIIVADTKEEAIAQHKAMKTKADVDAFDDAMHLVYRLEDSVSHIEEEVDKSVQALDYVNKDSYSKDVVKKYIAEIKKYVEESGFKENIDKLSSVIRKHMSRSNSWKEWKEKCLATLPECSVADAQNVENILEELCH